LGEFFSITALATRSVYQPGEFWVRFIDDDATWKVTITGRNLEVIYTLVIQRRLEWGRVADRDLAADKEPIITRIDVEKEEEK